MNIKKKHNTYLGALGGGLKRNPVKIGSGPASVSVDETRKRPLFHETGMGRRGE
jgi:hypothetical protein